MSYKSGEHLEWIEIENFKCFDKLKVEGLERVNLIGGDNNVGKTAFMEAVFLNSHSKSLKTFITALHEIHWFREQLNILSDNINEAMNFDKNIKDSSLVHVDFKIYSNLYKIIYFKKLDDLNNITYTFIINNNKKVFKLEDITINVFEYIANINFLDSKGQENTNLKKLYSSIQIKNKETELNELINYFDKRIENFKFINDTPMCLSDDKYFSLSSFGDGLRHFITIICAIWASRDGALFIDEIENGIHYTKLPKLWEIIFKTSKEVNCQVFATTHSRETIEAFNQMQFKEDGEETTYFEFARFKGGDKIFASKIDRDELEYGLTHNEPLRGEKEVLK